MIVAGGHTAMSVSAAAALVMICCAIAAPCGVEASALCHAVSVPDVLVDPCWHGALTLKMHWDRPHQVSVVLRILGNASVLTLVEVELSALPPAV